MQKLPCIEQAATTDRSGRTSHPPAPCHNWSTLPAPSAGHASAPGTESATDASSSPRTAFIHYNSVGYFDDSAGTRRPKVPPYYDQRSRMEGATKMTLPGYTAEITLYRSTQAYRLSVASGGGTEQVHPAQFLGTVRSSPWSRITTFLCCLGCWQHGEECVWTDWGCLCVPHVPILGGGAPFVD